MLSLLKQPEQEIEMLQQYIRAHTSPDKRVDILEAGCGQKWTINLSGVQYHLTGVDIDKDALEIRKNKTKDLDKIIEGDLRTVNLEENTYDLIYNSYVLEHIDGAENVLNRFCKWLRPGGLIILRIPDRYSAYGFLTRMTPFWVHVFYKKHLMGDRNAGKPGFAPYRVFYNRIVSRDGIHEFCKKNNMTIREELGHPYPMPWDRFSFLLSSITRVVWFFSFGKLAYAHNNLTYILQKKEGLSEATKNVRTL